MQQWHWVANLPISVRRMGRPMNGDAGLFGLIGSTCERTLVVRFNWGYFFPIVACPVACYG